MIRMISIELSSQLMLSYWVKYSTSLPLKTLELPKAKTRSCKLLEKSKFKISFLTKNLANRSRNRFRKKTNKMRHKFRSNLHLLLRL